MMMMMLKLCFQHNFLTGKKKKNEDGIKNKKIKQLEPGFDSFRDS
jgi:hypothetical protein